MKKMHFDDIEPGPSPTSPNTSSTPPNATGTNSTPHNATLTLERERCQAQRATGKLSRRS